MDEIDMNRMEKERGGRKEKCNFFRIVTFIFK
jgi:hypothetical protein